MAATLEESVQQLALGNPDLVELDLEHDETDGTGPQAIGAAGAQAIADALRENSTLAELSLKANPIDHAGLHALFRALRGNWWAITKLDLDNDMPMRNDILEAIVKNCEMCEAVLWVL
jgi:hypothetical protein